MGDFERTFGAGANIESIINGYSSERRFDAFDTYWIDFFIFEEARDFAKENPGSVITRSDGERYRVIPSKEKKYFRFTDWFSEHCKAEPAEFVINIPKSPELCDESRRPSCEWEKETDEATFVNLRTYVSVDSCTYYQTINRQPFDLETIKSNLKAVDLGLFPVSEFLCLIVSSDTPEYFSIEAALFTQNGRTELVHGCKDNRIYKMLA